MHGTQRWARVASLAAATALVAGSLVANAASAQEPKTVGLWTHSAGNPAEMENINKWIEEFNASQTDWKLEVQAFPQGAYNETVVAAALSNSLPCILDVDGPNVPNWAWSGYLKELNIPQETLDQFLESTHGYWDGKPALIGIAQDISERLHVEERQRLAANAGAGCRHADRFR